MKKAILVAAALCCVLGCSEDSNSPSCTAGESRCSSDGLSQEVCSEAGVWKATPCQSDEVCKENACVKSETSVCDKSADSCAKEDKDFDSEHCKCVAKEGCDKSEEICAKEDKDFNEAKCECVDKECSLSTEICGKGGKDFDESRCECVDKECSLSEEICAKEGKDFDESRCECVDKECSLSVDICSKGGKDFDESRCECVDKECSLSEEICGKEGLVLDSENCRCVLTERICNKKGMLLDVDSCDCVDLVCGKSNETCAYDGLMFDAEKCSCVAKICELTEETCGAEDKALDPISCTCIDKMCHENAAKCQNSCKGFYASSLKQCWLLDQSEFLQAKNAEFVRTKDGKEIKTQLRGVVIPNLFYSDPTTISSQYTAAVDKKVLQALKDNLNVNTIRFTIPIVNPKKLTLTETNLDNIYINVKKGIDNASALGMYVIVDWGIIAADKSGDGSNIQGVSDPESTLKASDTNWISAEDFFSTIAEYSINNPYVLYEIANEPTVSHGDTTNAYTWKVVKSYMDIISDKIRRYSHNTIIVAGAGGAILSYAITDPVIDDNVAYTFHNYPYNNGFDETYTDQSVEPNEKISYGEALKKAIKQNMTIVSTEMAPIDAAQADSNQRDEVYLGDNWQKYMDLYCENGISYAWYNFAFPWDDAKYTEWNILKPRNKKQYEDGFESVLHMSNLNINSEEFKEYVCTDKSSCENKGFGTLTENGFEFYRHMKGFACNNNKYKAASVACSK